MVAALLELNIRILIAGSTSDTRASVVELLRRAGYEEVHTLERLPPAAEPAAADLIILTSLDAMPSEPPAQPMLGVISPSAPATAWAAATAPAAPAARTSGAARVSDVLSLDDAPELVRARVANVMAAGDTHRMSQLARQSAALTRIHGISAEQGDSVNALRQILVIALDIMGFERASLVAHVEGSDAAYVIAATDAPEFAQFAVAVDKYPEIRAALNSHQPVLLHDAQDHAITASVADLLAQVEVRGMAVFPIVWMAMPLGALVFRKRDAGVSHVDSERQGFARVLAHHLAVCLHHGKVMEALRESTTHRLSRGRYEAERRLRTIDSLKEHFEASADGVLILDEQGRILFVNLAAEAILGFTRGSLMGSEIESLVRQNDEPVIREVIARVLGGHNLGAFDLDLLTLSGETICVSATTSTVLGSSGAAVLAFRDVTAQRALEAELRQTKEFLEKLVDSTVDAIVAADMRGNVIIFNQGAERIHGYRAEEVIGHIPVWGLYGEGVAKQIMRMLRSTQYGGVGRLEQTRREIKSKKGDLVPVNMTASILYQDGREVATVGIFSDLRERIRIEQRLLQAQEKLQMTEKQALVAELAGVAAHELNQPLTSIMGYAELLIHRGTLDPSSQRPVQVILDEAERMAEIVKKIGRITRYETKLYVGSTRMLDLDRSTRAATAEHMAEAYPAETHGADDHVSHEGRVGHEFDDEVTGQVAFEDLTETGERKRETRESLRRELRASDYEDSDEEVTSPEIQQETRPARSSSPSSAHISEGDDGS